MSLRGSMVLSPPLFQIPNGGSSLPDPWIGQKLRQKKTQKHSERQFIFKELDTQRSKRFVGWISAASRAQESHKRDFHCAILLSQREESHSPNHSERAFRE